MKLKRHFKIENKDLGMGLVLLLGLFLVLIKLVLCSAQNVFLWPAEAVLDDMVMYDAAVSITEGGWLGAYGWKTLSKYSFFSLWLAGLHTLGIPYLLGGQLLWAGAALAAAAAFAPVLKKRWVRLLLFAVLWFNPASVANPASMAGFTLRVYRDNIFPALCLLCVAAMSGFALRLWQSLPRTAWWLVLAGVSFAATWLCREDGWWITFFVAGVAAGLAFICIFAKKQQTKKRFARILCLLLPFAILAGSVLGWKSMNLKYYGVFEVSDFTTGAFADAYGAITRIKHENWRPKVAVPKDVRQKLYNTVPAFKELEPVLESDFYLGRYAGDDYSSGSFYWALREAAAELGYYDNAIKAEEYFAAMADEINALCDSGVLPADGKKRSGVNPPIKAAYVAPVLKEGFSSLWFCATFKQCDPRSMYSPGGNDAEYYNDILRPMEEFLKEKALTVTKENSAEPYFSPKQRMAFLAFDVIRALYAVLLPAAFMLSLIWLVWQAARMAKNSELRKKEGMVWLVCLGILLCILLRAFMIAFVTVSSFEIGTFVMYLASIHPLMLLLGFAGTAQLLQIIAARRVWRRTTNTLKEDKPNG